MLALFPELANTVNNLALGDLAAYRKNILQPLIDYIQFKLNKDEEVNLNFICTHNSRRSQLAQIWTQTAADYYQIKANCYSGGTEVTAFNSRAVDAIKRSGFHVINTVGDNPVYKIYHSPQSAPIIAFSKLYDDPENKVSPFAAIMTCSHADENCPFIPGAEKRISVWYEDPKAYDDSEDELEKYDERSKQIATEMFYVFSQVRIGL